MGLASNRESLRSWPLPHHLGVPSTLGRPVEEVRLGEASAITCCLRALTLAGLPLTAGFVSEWFLLEALMQQFRLGPLGYTPAAGGHRCAGRADDRLRRGHVRAHRRPRPARPPRRAADPRHRAAGQDRGRRHGRRLPRRRRPRAAGAAAARAGLDPLVSRTVTAAARKEPWVLQPVFDDFSILAPSWLVVMLPALLAARPRSCASCSPAAGCSPSGGYRCGVQRPAERVSTRRSRSRTPPGRSSTRAELRIVERRTGGRDDDSRRAARLRRPPRLHLRRRRGRRTLLYRPLLRPLCTVLRAAKRLQNGRLDAYVDYMLIAFLAMLAVVLVLT